ncbi:ChaN family lipoprotein [Thermosulfuriphilus sp.]
MVFRWLLVLVILSLFLSPPQSLAKEEEPLKINLFVSFSLKDHLLRGTLTTDLPNGKVVWFEVGNIVLRSVSLAGKAIEPEIEGNAFRIMALGHNRRLKINFIARFDPRGLHFSQGGEALAANAISPKGILLTGGWFPAPRDLAVYHLTAVVPHKFRAIAPADEIKVKRKKKGRYYRFKFPHPTEPPPLVAGPYHIADRKEGETTVAVYTLSEDPNLTVLYLEKTIAYLRLYSEKIGPFVYRRLAVVESPYEVGYSFPGVILLGSKVMRLPFIPETSLPHEVLHQWLGCSVFVDEATGNWSEGLTTYLADHSLAEAKGEGVAYRHRLLVEYQSFAGAEGGALKDFYGRYDRLSKVIGYNKGAMFFHMLKKTLGEDVFLRGVRRFWKENLFRRVGWEDLEGVFSEVSGQDLSDFFSQWLESRVVPKIKLSGALVTPKDSGFVLTFSLIQEGPIFRVSVPLKVITESEEKNIFIELKERRQVVNVNLSSRPQTLILDPGYDLLRYLADDEYPPCIWRLLGARGIGIVAGPEEQALARPLVDYLLRRGAVIIPPKRLTDFDQETMDLLFISQQGPPGALKGLFEASAWQGHGFFLGVKRSPWASNHFVALVLVEDPEATKRLFPRILHLGRYQEVYLGGGETVLREAPVGKGHRLELIQEIPAVDISRLTSLTDILPRLARDRVIYLGEQHDEYSHHLTQLEIIRALVERFGLKVAIGMEMFQQPYQPVLDDYLAGRIDEFTFLKKTEYFKRWGMDFRLYKPILDYAKEKGLPVVALNIPKEISEKVARKGLEELSPEEKVWVPGELDFSNEVYRARLKKVFEQHPEGDVKDFETFYQSQILWDEAMALAIVKYLKEHPEEVMVVIVGKGHVMYSAGIPDRVWRRHKVPYSILVMSSGERLEPGLADYVLYPAPVKAPTGVKLGVYLKETEDGLEIKGVAEESPAEKAGLKKGDIIIAADSQPIKTVADLRLILYGKNKGDKVIVEVVRDKKKKTITVGPL